MNQLARGLTVGTRLAPHLTPHFRNVWGTRPPCCAAASTDDSGRSDACCHRVEVTALAPDWADELSDVMLAMGAQAVSIEEHRPSGVAEQEIFYDGHRRLWQHCTLVAHFPLDVSVERSMSDIEANSGIGLQYTVQPVAQAEWSDAVKGQPHTVALMAMAHAVAVGAAQASYQPITVNEHMTIVPAWQLDTHIPPSLDHITLILEPGLAFGTGDHPTTQLCLRWLLQQRGVLGNAHVVDYGTGSGVLAIASLLLGASQAVGTDTDPLAVKASQRNGELNGVWGGLRVVQCMPSLDDEEPLAVHGLPSGQAYDVVIANILQGPLLDLGPRLCSYAKPGGLIALSGILESQVPAVREVYSTWCDDLQATTQGQWALVTATRKTSCLM